MSRSAGLGSCGALADEDPDIAAMLDMYQSRENRKKVKTAEAEQASTRDAAEVGTTAKATPRTKAKAAKEVTPSSAKAKAKASKGGLPDRHQFGPG